MRTGDNYSGARWPFSDGTRKPRSTSTPSGLSIMGGSNRPTEVHRDGDPDDDYPDPSADGFHPYWLGRTSEALRYLLANPESDTARHVAAETLAAYASRTGQGVR